jgi:class 3 adenylate cyclase
MSTVADIPEIRYAKTADGPHIAFQVLGDGPLDLLCFGYGSNLSIDTRDEEPHLRRFERSLAAFSRFIRFDHRGLGLSDPVTLDTSRSLEDWVDDALAVLDAAGSDNAAFLACGIDGPTAMLAAATHTDRCSSLVLVNSYAYLVKDDTYPYGYPRQWWEEWIDAVVTPSTKGGEDGPDDVELLTPSLSSDQEYRAWWKRAGQRSASPAMARARLMTTMAADVRAVLSSIAAPTLILHRTECAALEIGHAEYLAEHIDGARLAALPGADLHPFAGDSQGIVGEIEEFLTGMRGGSQPDRILATVMFTDIVGSTEQAVRQGDRAWRDCLDRHESTVDDELRRHRGRRVKFTGDGVLATFDGPARAMRCAKAIVAGGKPLGLELRAGLHTGEIEARANDVSGIAVHVAQRVSDLARPGEVLVSRTVTDLVAGSGIEFEDRGEHKLKGLPGSWKLFAVTQAEV